MLDSINPPASGGGRGGAAPDATRPPCQVVLVLQGGGALGAYQAGVYQALHEGGIAPDWVIGTSIGAINAALIAGNRPENRVRRMEEFWRRMHAREFHGLANWPGLDGAAAYWSTLLGGIPAFFEPNPFAFFGAAYPLGTERAGFYSAAPLAKTLTELIDVAMFERCSPRLTVGAAHVRTSRMHYFDSRAGAITIRHVMASGALPPAFPAVRIDGELYWDGGILSNTPIEAIFDDIPRRDSLIFTVHMWNPAGPEPATIADVLHRQKDIQYSSRVSTHIAKQRQLHKLRHVVSELAKFIPEAQRNDPAVKDLAEYGCLTRMHVVELLAPRIDNENYTKDADFSAASIRLRWQAGYADTMGALQRAAWNDPSDPLEGVIMHEPSPPDLAPAKQAGRGRRCGVAFDFPLRRLPLEMLREETAPGCGRSRPASKQGAIA